MLTKQDADDLSNCYSKIFGLTRKELIWHINQVSLITWEQVLLVALYARQQYSAKFDQFHGRMAFVNVLNNADFALLQCRLLPLLDSGKSFLTIMGALQTSQDSWQIDAAIYRRFVNTVEEKQIAFPRLQKPYFYSHQALYTALTGFIRVCQDLLAEPPTEKYCHQLIYEYLDQKRGHYFNSMRNKEKETLTEWALKQKQGTFDIIKFLNQKLAEDMQNKLSRFGTAPGTFVDKDLFQHNGKKNQNWITVTASHSDQSSYLNIKSDVLKRFLLMGKSDQVSRIIMEELFETISKGLTLPYKNDEAREQASPQDWSQNCRVLDIKRMDQIPWLVALLLSFDMRYAHQTLFTVRHEIQLLLKEPLKREEEECAVSAIIRHCFLRQGNPLDFQKVYAVTFSKQTFTPDNQTDLPLRTNQLMESWGNEDPIRIRNLFKARYKQFNELIDSAESIVKKQMAKAMRNPYPIEAGFPPPLWMVIPQNEDSAKPADGAADAPQANADEET